MNDIKGIIEDVEKSDIVSDKVIKKVIEIIGQEKWQDINDELSDICTTTGELIITLKGIPDLEEENRALKSLLYCTKRSCNNCGKVNCENFQRQRIDCCGLWVSYKDYINKLEKEYKLLGERCNQLLKDKGNLIDQIADIKANCDLAIEGKDVKIMELEKENAELKGSLELYENGCCRAVNECAIKEQLAQAKEIIKELLLLPYANNEEVYADVTSTLDKAEQFLKEIEK